MSGSGPLRLTHPLILCGVLLTELRQRARTACPALRCRGAKGHSCLAGLTCGSCASRTPGRHGLCGTAWQRPEPAHRRCGGTERHVHRSHISQSWPAIRCYKITASELRAGATIGEDLAAAMRKHAFRSGPWLCSVCWVRKHRPAAGQDDHGVWPVPHGRVTHLWLCLITAAP